MATKTFEELKQMAIQIRDEKTNKQNTATRIGTQMLEHLDKLEQEYYDKTNIDEQKKQTDTKFSELERDLSIYRSVSFSQIVEKTEVNGRISTSTNQITVTSSNWYGVIYPIKEGDKIEIKVNQSKAYLSDYALIAFVEEFINDNTAVVLANMGEVKEHDLSFYADKDGYIYILPNISGTDYATIIGVYKAIKGEYIDFQSIIGDSKSLDEDIKGANIVESLNNVNKKIKSNEPVNLDIYKEIVEISIEKNSSGQYRALKGSNVVNFVGDNITADTYLVEKDKNYKIYSTQTGGIHDIFALAFLIEGTEITNGMPCTILEYCTKDSYEISFTPPSNGTLFIQTKINDTVFTNQLKRLDLGELIDFSKLISEQQKEIDQNKLDIKDLSAPPTINIPDIIYAVVGDTLQLFYRSIVACIDISNYDIRFVSDVGKSYPRYYEYTPNSSGDKNVKIEIRNLQREIIATKSFVIRASEVPQSPSEDYVIATFGDSLSAKGVWQKELNRRLTSSDLSKPLYPKGDNLSNCSLIGTMDNEGTKYFGVGGWAWVDYATQGSKGWRFQVSGVSGLSVGAEYSVGSALYTIVEVNITEGTGNILTRSNSSTETPPASGVLQRRNGDGDETISYSSVSEDASNPLWNNDSVSYIPYVERCGKSKLDCVAFLLGWNILYVDLSPNESYIKTLIETAHKEYPNIKVALLGVQLPSLNGGLASNYIQTSLLADLFCLIQMVHDYNAFLQRIANEYEYVYYVDVASQFDSENNMPEQEKNVNTRNQKIELIGTNGVHPSDSGYYQIADVLYRFLCNVSFIE